MKAFINRFLVISSALFIASTVHLHAQNHVQNTVAVSGLGDFPSSTSSSNTQQNPYNQAGFMVELRHISNPLMGFDVSYSFHRADQGYKGPTPYCPSGALPCITPSQSVHANAQELALNWVVSAPIANFRIFALAGGGFQNFDPTGTQTGGTQSQTKGVFDYGAGADWTVLPHLGLRFQYRGNVYKAPALATAFSSTGKFTQDAEPMIGAYFRF